MYCANKQKYTYPKHYFRWRQMKARCFNPKNREYKRYGARGIRVCKAWLDFKTFQKWCLETQEKGKTIDRKNNDGNYSPRNCRWATPLEQQMNARRRTPARLAAMKYVKSLQIKALHEKYGNPKTRVKKLCGRCKRVRLNKFFSKNKSTSDGLQKACAECFNKYVRSKK